MDEEGVGVNELVIVDPVELAVEGDEVKPAECQLTADFLEGSVRTIVGIQRAFGEDRVDSAITQKRVGPGEDFAFGAFDIDFQKIDGIDAVLRSPVVEGLDGDRQFLFDGKIGIPDEGILESAFVAIERQGSVGGSQSQIVCGGAGRGFAACAEFFEQSGRWFERVDLRLGPEFVEFADRLAGVAADIENAVDGMAHHAREVEARIDAERDFALGKEAIPRRLEDFFKERLEHGLGSNFRGAGIGLRGREFGGR